MDKASFAAGDDSTFTAKFTPASLQFPLVGYNAVKVRLYKKSGTGPNPSLTLIAEAPMQTGQSEVTLTGVATPRAPATSWPSCAPRSWTR